MCHRKTSVDMERTHGKRPVHEGQQTLDNEGTLDGFFDDKESNRLCWTYDKDTATVLHATGCPPCAEWKAHFQDDEEGTLLRARIDREVHIRYTLLQGRMDALRWERDECRREVDMLRLEVEANAVEVVEEIRKETARIREATRLMDQLCKLPANLSHELEEAQRIPPSDASSPPSPKTLPQAR
jgi:hypothetical protein